MKALIDKNLSNFLEKPTKILFFSAITAIISTLTAIFTLPYSLTTKIIISLLIICIILFIDVVTIYVKLYEYYYEIKYTTKISTLIDINIANLFKETARINKKLDYTQSKLDNLNKIEKT